VTPIVQSDTRIAFDGISFAYEHGGPPVVSDTELTIGKGEFVLLLGPGGCGRTTVLVRRTMNREAVAIGQKH